MDLWEAIGTRRTVRKFDARPVPRETIERILDAAIAAPSPLNSQPWRFYIATGSSRDELVAVLREFPFFLADVVKHYPEVDTDSFMRYVKEFAEDMGHAPVIVIITTPKIDDGYIHKTNLLAAAAAAQNIQLAAWAAGLGAVCLTSAIWVEQKILEAVGATEEELVTVIPLGYPDEEPPQQPRDHSRAVWL